MKRIGYFFWYKNSNIIKKIDFMKKNIFSINHFGSKRAIRINVKYNSSSSLKFCVTTSWL
jgi:hypothetical protein